MAVAMSLADMDPAGVNYHFYSSARTLSFWSVEYSTGESERLLCWLGASAGEGEEEGGGGLWSVYRSGRTHSTVPLLLGER